MDKEPVVDYLKAVAKHSEETRPLDEEVVLPEQAGAPVVDYEIVADKWKEEKGRMNREKP